MLHKSILACAALLLLVTPSEARPKVSYFPASACAFACCPAARPSMLSTGLNPVAAAFYWNIKHAMPLRTALLGRARWKPARAS